MRFPLRVFSRITLQLTASCAIGSGEDSVETDQPFVTDFNGLPALPGSGLAGMLRHAFRRAERIRGAEKPESQDGVTYDKAREDRWFGWQKGDAGQLSCVRCSWGHIHDENDLPVEGLLSRDEQSDFLKQLAQGQRLEHVRISHLGAADKHGKFDREVVMSGARFTFDLEIVGLSDDSPDDTLQDLVQVRDELLQLLHGPTTRLGGATHSGFGTFKLMRVHSKAFDLRNVDDFEAFSRIPVRLDEPLALPALDLRAFEPPPASAALIEVTLEPETFFVMGGGAPLWKDGAQNDKATDINPVRRSEVSWKNHRASILTPTLYLPATALKGALSHRVAFHYNRLTGNFAVPRQDLGSLVGARNPAVRALFGYCKDSHSGDGGGAAGKLLFSDVDLTGYESHQRKLTHTSIDSFTGGVRNRMLFSEMALRPKGPPIRFSILVEDADALDPVVLQSLQYALSDLTSGRLAIGSGCGRGNGRFQGNFTWPERLQAAIHAAQHDAQDQISSEVIA